MPEPLRMLCVFAHPDDEALGMGSTIVRYAAEGVELHLVCATRGERGWFGPPETDPGLEAMGRLREDELRCAAETLGFRSLTLLDYIDGDLDQADPCEAAEKIAAHIRRLRPQVVVTFAPDGAYGHPDHIAISQFTLAAAVLAAGDGFQDSNPPHQISKLYYVVDSIDLVERFARLYGRLSMEIDGVAREHIGWPDWAITARLDNTPHLAATVHAINCHQSQLAELGDLGQLSPDDQQAIFGVNNFFRAFSLVNSGRAVESDLFAGLRAK